jgi:hypothetical protein
MNGAHAVAYCGTTRTLTYDRATDSGRLCKDFGQVEDRRLTQQGRRSLLEHLAPSINL